MPNGIYNVPAPINEPVLSYASGSAERKEIKTALKLAKSTTVDIPMVIGGEEIRTGKTVSIHPPHEINHTLGVYHEGDVTHVQAAIDAALKAKSAWEQMGWEDRAAIFLKAADLIAGPYRAKINTATMLGQSKNVYQAEIDAACELIDFLRFNVRFMQDIYASQPVSSSGIWNRLEYRPLEGFVLAITPFNFTAIAANLCVAPALMGNVVVWKPSPTQVYSAIVIMEILIEAGLPDGVINMILTDGSVTGELAFSHPDFAGIHFTGSTKTFKQMWQTIGSNINQYKTYPRIVGETGGKDFVIAHASANVKALVTGLIRGAFEYQGQKCSAASRAYIPSNLWLEVKKVLIEDMSTLKMGTVEDFSNFVNAVIDEVSFDKIAAYLNRAKQDDVEIIAGGNCDKSKGYFIEPTVIVTKDAKYTTMCEELFGPVLTIYVYDENQYEETLTLIDETSEYALTGAVFAKEKSATNLAQKKLKNAAGNFYINDKPSGAVVGQQPFGGARASGTNDKAGSYLNLIRWVSARTIKETLVSPTDYRYSFMQES